jgi:hypothetical protein
MAWHYLLTYLHGLALPIDPVHSPLDRLQGSQALANVGLLCVSFWLCCVVLCCAVLSEHHTGHVWLHCGG